MATLNELTKSELLTLAEQYGSEVRPNMTKADIVAILEIDGVTPEYVAEDQAAREDEPVDAALIDGTPIEQDEEAPVVDDDVVLVRMLRSNPTYQVRGYTFRSTHPFVLVKESDADYLIEEYGGFRMASPKEAREFYS